MGRGQLEKKKRKEIKEKKRKNKKGEVRSSNFSLDSTVIRPSVLVGVRGKVGPRNDNYTWVPKSADFSKLQEVGVFLLLGLIIV